MINFKEQIQKNKVVTDEGCSLMSALSEGRVIKLWKCRDIAASVIKT